MQPRRVDSNSLLDRPPHTPSRLRPLAAGCALGGLLVAMSVCALGLGPVAIGPGGVAASLANHIFHTHIAVAADADAIVWSLRMPRVLVEILVGASLATAGVAFQALLRNPLAEPYTIGVSSGASVGVGLVIVLGLSGALGGYAPAAAALAGAVITLLAVYALSRIGGRVDVRSLLLSGVIAGAFLWAIQMLLFRLASKNDDEILAWMMGSLSGVRWSDAALLSVPTFAGVLALAMHARSMNLYSLGEDPARHLGLEPEPFKAAMIFLGSLLTACTVAVAGIIGFVGLVVPHLSRSLAGTPDHRVVLPISLLGGALMVEIADTTSRLAMGGEMLPVGAVTALLGCPFFFYLLRRAK
ncbi:MAG: iron ABC transporter permease [Capsulimonadaceae bacterium]|nr:iron ABC transporter permease [Capsulimonadaceae bacterium]